MATNVPATSARRWRSHGESRGGELLGHFGVPEGVKRMRWRALSPLAATSRKGEKLTAWPPCSSDLNPIENLGEPFLKPNICERGRQFTSKQQLWEVILTSRKRHSSRNSPKTHKVNGCKEFVKLISNKGTRNATCSDVFDRNRKPVTSYLTKIEEFQLK